MPEFCEKCGAKLVDEKCPTCTAETTAETLPEETPAPEVAELAPLPEVQNEPSAANAAVEAFGKGIENIFNSGNIMRIFPFCALAAIALFDLLTYFVSHPVVNYIFGWLVFLGLVVALIPLCNALVKTKFKEDTLCLGTMMFIFAALSLLINNFSTLSSIASLGSLGGFGSLLGYAFSFFSSAYRSFLYIGILILLFRQFRALGKDDIYGKISLAAVGVVAFAIILGMLSLSFGVLIIKGILMFFATAWLLLSQVKNEFMDYSK